jgi:hypothetical protein
MTMKYTVAIAALMLWATSASAQSNAAFSRSGFFGPGTGPLPPAIYRPGYACPINLKCDGKNIRPLDPNTPPVERATKAQRLNRQRLEAVR